MLRVNKPERVLRVLLCASIKLRRGLCRSFALLNLDVFQGAPKCAQRVERVFQGFLFFVGAAAVEEFAASRDNG